MICKSQKTIFYSQQNIENMSNVPTNSLKKKKTGSVCVQRQQHILIKLRQRQQKAGNVSGTKQKPLEELLIIIFKKSDILTKISNQVKQLKINTEFQAALH